MSSLKEVANLSNVSIATVSRVINNDPKVSFKTKLKVESVIQRLNYLPNRVAQRLRSSHRKTKLIGLVIPDIQNPFYVDVVRGVEEYSYQNGFAVMIGNFGQDEKKQQMYLEILQSENVDGFILAPALERDDKVRELVDNRFPLVCIDRELHNSVSDVVKVDNTKGAFMAIDHLLGLGHRKIAVISGNLTIQTYIDRLQGYKMALEKHKVQYNPALIFAKGSDFLSGVELTNQILEMDIDKRPTAIFTANNLITLGSLETVHKKNIKIPEDISIVGFDDMYWSSSLNPPLTAVSQPGFEIGKKAADMLNKRIMNPEKPMESIELKTKLIIRKSTKTI
jgi:LacI family transcriptional regulator/LacI family repressor for deo operon, udp, cdd, tsx, nupC, and nupG